METQRWVAIRALKIDMSMAITQTQILQNVVAQGKKLGKAVYVFSVNVEGGKVAHANYVPEEARAKGFDARMWACKVTEVLGGKVRLSKRDPWVKLIKARSRLEERRIALKVLVST